MWFFLDIANFWLFFASFRSFFALIHLTKLAGEHPTQRAEPDKVEKTKNCDEKNEIFHILTFFFSFFYIWVAMTFERLGQFRRAKNEKMPL